MKEGFLTLHLYQTITLCEVGVKLVEASSWWEVQTEAMK